MKKHLILMSVLAFCLSTPAFADNHDNGEKGGKRMEKHDTNGDGYISKEEMIEAHKERINKMFEKHDKDGDGKLSKEELRKSKKAMKKHRAKRKASRLDNEENSEN